MPGASRIVWPGRAFAMAVVSCAAVATSTMDPPGEEGGVDGDEEPGEGDGDGEGELGEGNGAGPPAHGAPLTRQLTGTPVPLTLKPKLVDAPGAMAPFQDALANRWCWPVLVRTESHELLTVDPAGRSNSTTQPLAAASPRFVIVMPAPYPELHVDDWVNVAVSDADAAWASGATNTVAAATATAPPASRNVRWMRIDQPLVARASVG
ncbi:hypothetical protein GCM10010399_21500 [Dactylosporangium fulvum]